MRTSLFAVLLFAASITGAKAQGLIIEDGHYAVPPAVVVPAAPIVRSDVVVVRRAPVFVERPPVVMAPAPLVVAPRLCPYGYYC
ncbi:hypothetical protein JQ615_31060 [Bradyrhizobium jicamae]|uniref:Uncharacterized protein n=1 Tax=Bradyrhizobium jicamae TaxID=280332 RepID=A0ABS5FSL0_9BRAD|nr:hypothetical protein [Bradyrhizobium jicamae]MBR0799819.1 hypothetical protein [Bradyrhizobium jicamae]